MTIETATDFAGRRSIPSHSDIAGRLTRIWQDLLGVANIAPEQNYFDLGGDSSLAVRMFAQIEDVFGVKLPLATLFDAPTIGELSQLLDRPAASTWSPLVAIQPYGNRPPFFCIHGAGGNVLIYRDLARWLGPDQPFFGLQSQGLDGVANPLTTIEEMASLYVKKIKEAAPDGPYFLGGYCMGGTVAYEVAQQLQAQGGKVALLALFDTMNWSAIPKLHFWNKAYHSFQRLLFHVANFFCLDVRGVSRFLWEKLEALWKRIPVWAGMLLSNLEPGRMKLAMPESRILGRLWRINDRACTEYVPRPYPGRVTDFRPRQQYRLFGDPRAKWDSLALSGQEVVILPVYPAGMLVEPFVKHLARELRKAMDSKMQNVKSSQ